MDEGARFPAVAAKAGHYESFYIKACRPGGGRGIWIRHTVHKRPGAEPNASIWFVLFDREAEAPRATKVTVPAAELSAPPAPGSGSPMPRSGRRRASGAIETEALERHPGTSASPATPTPCKYLPADWLYEAPLPRTKFVAPYPDARFDGRLEVDGETIAARRLAGDDRPQLGQRARRALGLARGHRLRGRARHLLRRRRRADRARSLDDPLAPLGDAGARRRGAPPRRPRQDPLGIDPGVADRLRVHPARQGHRRPRQGLRAEEGLRRLGLRRPQGPRAQHPQLLGRRPGADRRTPRARRPASSPSAAGAAYELGMRETDHGIPIQPYPDG